MPGAYDWLRSMWQKPATPPPPSQFTPYTIAPRTPAPYGPFLDKPEETDLDRQIAKIRTDSDARLADLRALDERLGEKSAALKPMPVDPLAGVVGGVRAGLADALPRSPMPIIGRLDEFAGRGMEEAFKPRGPAAYLLKKWQEATAGEAAREVPPEEATERNLRMARFGTPPQTPEQFRQGAELTKEVGDPTMGFAAMMGGSAGGVATAGMGALAGAAGREGALGVIGRGARMVKRPVDALFALEGGRQIGHAIGDEGLTWKERAVRGGMGGFMALVGGRGAATPGVSAETTALADAMKMRREVMGPTPGVKPKPPGWVPAAERAAAPPPEPPVPVEAPPVEPPPPAPPVAGPPARGVSPFVDRDVATMTRTELRAAFVEAAMRGDKADMAKFSGEKPPPAVVPPAGAPAAIEPLEPAPPEGPQPVFSPVPRTVAPGAQQPTLQTILEGEPPGRPVGAPPPAVSVRPPSRPPLVEPGTPPGTARSLVPPKPFDVQDLLKGEKPPAPEIDSRVTGLPPVERRAAPRGPTIPEDEAIYQAMREKMARGEPIGSPEARRQREEIGKMDEAKRVARAATEAEQPAFPGAAEMVERPVPPPTGAPRNPNDRYVEITDPTVLGIDAKTYQHKRSDVQGVTGSLRGATEWAADSPPLMVHELTDGSLKVVNGHQRYNLYMRLRAEGKTLPPLVVNVKREVDGWTVAKVRKAAALQNMQEPTTDPVDIAKVLREGPLTPQERGTIARSNLVGNRFLQGEALSQLGDDAYEMVVTNELIPPEQGAAIVKYLKDPAQQARAVAELQKRGFSTKAEADAFLAELADTPFVQPSVFDGLPGVEQEGILTLVDQKTDLVRQIAGGLRRKGSAFSNLLRNEQKVTEVGNTLVGEVNKGILDETRSLLGYFEKYKNAQGSATRKAINVYAERLARGEVEYADAEAGIFDAIRADIEGGGPPPFGAPAGGPADLGGAGELANREQPPAAGAESVAPTVLETLKEAEPARRIKITRGMNGQVDVVFPDATHKLLFQFSSRGHRAVSGQNPRPFPEVTEWRTQLARALGVPEKDIFGIANRYRDTVIASTKGLEEGATVTAGRHDQIPAAPAEVPTILDDLKKQIDQANKPADTFALDREAAPPPTPKDLEAEFGQGRLGEEPPAKPLTPMEELIEKAKVDLSKEQREVAETVKPNEERMRELTNKKRPRTLDDVSPEEQAGIISARNAYIKSMVDAGRGTELEAGIDGMIAAQNAALERGGVDYARAVWEKGVARAAERAKPVPEGQVPWTELENGALVAPPGKDFAAVRLNEGQTHLAKDLAAVGWKYRSKWGQWFKNVSEESREEIVAEAQEILGAAKAKPSPTGVPAVPPPTVRGEGIGPGPVETRPVGEAPPAPSNWDQLLPKEKSFLTQRAGLTREAIDKMTMEEVRAHQAAVTETFTKARKEREAAQPAGPPPKETIAGQQIGHERPTPPREPLDPAVQEWADLIDAKVKNGELPDAPLQAERIIEVNRRAAERYKKLIVARAEGVKEGDITTLLENAKNVEFAPDEIRGAIELQKEVDNWSLQIGLRRAPGRKGPGPEGQGEPGGFPEPETPIRPPAETQHDLAQQRAQWLEDGSPDSLQKYAKSLAELQDRELAIQVRNKFSEEKAGPPKREPSGEILGGGLGDLQKMYETNPDKFWRLMGRVAGTIAGGTTGATIEKDDPLRGFIKGALYGWMLTSPKIYQKYTYQQIGKYAKAVLPGGGPRQTIAGRPALRLMPDAAKDINLWTVLRPGTVEHQIPELHRAVWDILDEYAKSAASGDLSLTTPAVRSMAHARYYKDAAETAVDMAKDYEAAGLKHKAVYARRLADQLMLKPTVGQRAWKSGMKKVGVDVDYNTVERIFGQNVYRIGIGWALDSGVANSTQPILGLRHYGVTDLLHGYRMARTPEGIAATEHLRIKRPIDVDTEGLPEVPEGPEPTTIGGKVKAYAKDPGRVMGTGDNYNRRVAYLAAMRYARRKLNLDAIRADDWAQEVVRTSQGDVGALGFNPLYRGPVMGTLRPYQKFPALLAENLFDTLFQPNKVTGGTFIAVLAGMAFLGNKVGLDISDMLLMGGRVMGIDPLHPMDSAEQLMTGGTTPAGRGVEDVIRHFNRTATHPIGLPGEVKSLEDLLNSDVVGAIGRYPAKVAATALRFAKYGTGAHMQRTPSGAPNPVTALEDAINLLGLKTTRQTGQTRLLQRATGQGREAQNAERYHRNEINRLYLQAVDRGDSEEASRLLSQLKTVDSAIATVKRGNLNRFERLLQSASPTVRAQLEASYGKQFRELQVPQ